MREALKALMNAGMPEDHARTLLASLEKRGYTVYRKKQRKNARRPNVSEPMTPELAAEIRAFFAANPNFTQQEIAHIFNVNSGRVNEALDELI